MTATPEPSLLARIPPLQAPGVVLRPVVEADAERYAAAFREDPDMGRLLGFDVDPTADWVRSRLQDAAARRARGVFAELAVADPTTDHLLGAMPLHHIDWTAARLELGIWLAAHARGRGIARAALSAMLDWLFEVEFRRVEFRTTPDNLPMCALASRLGFTREGVLRRHALERGTPVDVVVFGLLADEWSPGAHR